MDQYDSLRFQKDRCYSLMTRLPAGSRPLVLKALKAAERWHKGQHRSGSKAPYMTHIYHVVTILIEELGVTNPKILAAGALHDVVEDCGVTVSELRRKFGRDVSGIVESESENSFPNRKLYMDHFRTAPKSVLLVKVSDRIDNLRYISPKTTWPIDHRVRYILEAERYILPIAKRANSKAFSELSFLIKRYKSRKVFVGTYKKLRAEWDTAFGG